MVRVSVVEMFVTVTMYNASKKKDVVKKCLFLPDVGCFELSYLSVSYLIAAVLNCKYYDLKLWTVLLHEACRSCCSRSSVFSL